MCNATSFCVLTLTNRQDFSALAARLLLSRRYLRGPAPKTVVVFDDLPDRQAFCSIYNATHVCHSIVALTLASMLGHANYTRLRAAFFPEEEALGPDRRLVPAPGLDRRAVLDCPWRTGGRKYQALKKFYGAIHGPASCKRYFVSDAESFPFRPYNFSDLVRPHYVLSSWYEDRQGCTYTQNDWNGANCDTMLAQRLGLRIRHNSHKLPVKHAAQNTAVDQFWMYEVSVVRRALALAEAASGLSFPWLWWEWGTSDVAFYNQMALHFAELAEAGGPLMPQRILSLPDAIQREMPEAHQACCTCHQNMSTKALSDSWRRDAGEPCHDLKHLWSYCMVRAVGAGRIAAFLIEQLGMFGTWFEYQLPPISVVNGHHGYSWCINNCFNNRTLSLLSKARGVSIAGMLSDPIVRGTFAEQKFHG